MSDVDDILFGREGGVATVTLNRPQALNAFTLGMYRRFAPMLREWEDDPSIHAVLIRGAGERAFCAGGDVRAIAEAGQGISGDPALTSRFFREEYELIRHIHRYRKPYLAIIDGITMGGGAGVSVNGAYRIATERTMLAMPETGIGLFPDVGATRFLNLAPGHIGRYLALTGARLRPEDARYCGLATHFVPRELVPRLTEMLFYMVWRTDDATAQVEEALAAFDSDPGEPPLAGRRTAIDRCFAGDTVEQVLDALAREADAGSTDSEWAAQTRAGLLTKSPTSLKVTLRQLIVGRGCDIEGALALEYRLTQHFMQGHDFYEGVRAALIDKDQRPRWQPATLAEVSEAMVDGYFTPLDKGELVFHRPTIGCRRNSFEWEQEMARIGFIGLGNMGAPMAANLVKAQHHVTGYDIVAQASAALAEKGGHAAASAVEAAASGDIVITMLPAGPQVRAVYLGPDGIIAKARPGALLIDCSTIDVETARLVTAAAKEAGLAMLDAPVSGGVIGAEAGTLTFMVGGEAAAFARAEPILQAMGKTIVHAGPAGSGQTAKICNNMILAASMIAVCEGFALAEKLGLPAQTLFDICKTSTSQCWAMTGYCPVPGPVPAAPSNRGYRAGFTAANMLKDLRLAQQAAGATAAATPLGAAAANLYQLYVDSGAGGLDFSGIMQFLRREEPRQ